ncbi:MAG: hypothetical protein ABI895_15750 [Deltaproteobacteria bacterium]
MKRQRSWVGAGMVSLAMTAGCGTQDRKSLFSRSEALPERAAPANPGSSAVAVPPLSSPSAPPSAIPSPDSTGGRDGVPSTPALAADSSRPAPAPPAPEPANDEPATTEPDSPDQEPEPEPEPPSCALGEFGPLQKLSGLGLSGPLWGPVLSAADTGLFFVVTVSSGAEQIFFASRSDITSAQFSTGNPVPELASNAFDGTPFVSASGLRLYFYSTRQGSNGGSRDLWVAERSTPTGAFGAPTPLLELNTASGELLPRLSADELSIVFTSQRPEGRGATDIWQAQRSSAAAPFGAPENLAELNTGADETGAWLSSDGLTMFFTSNRAGGQGRLDIWRASRTSIDQPFGPAENMRGLNSPSDELDISLSSNERELLLSSDRDGVPELWRSVRACQ